MSTGLFFLIAALLLVSLIIMVGLFLRTEKGILLLIAVILIIATTAWFTYCMKTINPLKSRPPGTLEAKIDNQEQGETQ